MAKIITYNFISAEVNRGTEENPDIEQIFRNASFSCKTQADFDIAYSIAEKEAVGEIIVEGEFDAEVSDRERIAELEEALALILSGEVE